MMVAFTESKFTSSTSPSRVLMIYLCCYSLLFSSLAYGEVDSNDDYNVRAVGQRYHVDFEGVPSPSPSDRRELATQQDDNTVGTAFAPTTPGGKCLNNADYLKWKDGGYDNFGPDMQHCAESCTTYLAPGSCGFLTQCDPYPYRTCVTKCMGGDASVDRTKLGLVGGPYSSNCSACMGALSQCVVDGCTSKCITGEKSTNCGLNPARKHTTVDTTAIIGGTIGGAGALVIGSVIFAYFHSKKAHKARELSVADLAKLSHLQQQQAQMQAQKLLASYPSQQKITQQDVIAMMQQAQQYGVVSSPGPSASTSSLDASVESLTPYQQQYMMQQQQMIMQPGIMPPAMAPGLMAPAIPTQGVLPMAPPPGLSAPAAVRPLSAQQIANLQMPLTGPTAPLQTIQLVLKYDFVGERDDELTCRKGDIVFAIEENEGWWLAKTQDGRIGLVPSSYVAVNDIKISEDIKF